ncbi:MAG: hypothetical protein V3R85_05155, partial [Alphaproteobacteria bacterium]
PERDRQELAFQTALGASEMSRHGWTSPEGAESFSRARELCLRVGDERELFPIMWGFWMVYGARSDRESWHRTARELLEIAQKRGDSALLVQAHHASWGSPFHGALVSQIDHAEQGLAIYDPAEHSALAAQYGGHDAGVCGHCHKGIALWAAGYPDRAKADFLAARELAIQISHPGSMLQVHGLGGWLHAFDRNWQAVLDSQNKALALSTELGVSLWSGRLYVLRGWARVGLGQVEDGLSDIAQGQEMRTLRGGFGHATSIAAQAEALVIAGATEEALSVVDEAIPQMQKDDEQLWEANANTLKGELLLAQPIGRQDDAEACFRDAIDVARAQAAKMWELRAATSLARLWQTQDRTAEARDLLAPLYDWFTEGFDTVDLKIAKALLDELSRP